MLEAQCVEYPIKTGQRERLISWVAGLKDRSGEVVEVMIIMHSSLYTNMHYCCCPRSFAGFK